MGRHADGPTSWWWTPLRVALALTVLVVVFAYLQKADCFGSGGYQNEHQYTRLCYSDTYALYADEGLNARTNSAGDVTGRSSIPYRDHPVEYPPVIGGLMWAAAEVTAFVHPGEPADVAGIHNTTFFNVTALGLAVCALISTWTVAQLAGRRRVWDAAMVGALTGRCSCTPSPTGISRRSPRPASACGHGVAVRRSWAGALLGVGIATKLYPLFVLLALLMLCARAGLWRAAAKAIGGGGRPASWCVICRRS